MKFLEQGYRKIEVKRVPDEIEGINVAEKEIPTHILYLIHNAMDALP